MQFKDVIGHTPIKEHLIRGVQENRISHTQLFLGYKGSGNLALALAYTQYLFCKNRQPTDSCGQCSSCRKAHKLIHPDIHYSYPTIGGKAKSTDFVAQWRTAIHDNPYLNVYQWLKHLQADNKQGNITATECEDIIRKLNMTAYEASYKVLIMWMPEYLGKEGNRLLKLIEEPPKNTVFLLVAEKQELILATILSRTQLVNVPRLSDTLVAKALEEKKNIAPNTAYQVALLAEGSYNRAISLIENENQGNQKLLARWLQACIQRKAIMANTVIEEVAGAGREAQKDFLTYCLHFLRQCLWVKMVPTHQIGLSEAEKTIAKQIATTLHLVQLESWVTWFNNSIRHIGRNANPRILLLSLSIKIMDSFQMANKNK